MQSFYILNSPLRITGKLIGLSWGFVWSETPSICPQQQKVVKKIPQTPKSALGTPHWHSGLNFKIFENLKEIHFLMIFTDSILPVQYWYGSRGRPKSIRSRSTCPGPQPVKIWSPNSSGARRTITLKLAFESVWICTKSWFCLLTLHLTVRCMSVECLPSSD